LYVLTFNAGIASTFGCLLNYSNTTKICRSYNFCGCGTKLLSGEHFFPIFKPVSSEISDLRIFWLHAMCACTE